jgi:hypothetical protein
MEPNTPTSVILISACIGSASGIVLSKLIEISQAKRQHKLDLQKIFFQKKLEVFEKTTAFWNNAQSVVQSLNMALKSAFNPNHYADEKTSANIMSSISKEYYDISNESKTLTASLTLYTDIPIEFYVSTSFVEYFNIFGEFGQLLESAKNKTVTEEESDTEAANKMKRLDELTKEINRKATNLIKLLREDLKRFDV